MKYIKFYLFIFMLLVSIVSVQAQYKWWGGYTVNEMVNKSDLIFEGRILTDSSFFLPSPGRVYTVHYVLVLKKFKGDFKSDTIKVITDGGHMTLNGQSEGSPRTYGFIGDEAVFLVVSTQHAEAGDRDPNSFWILYGPGVGFVTPCNKKDPIKEIYAPLEEVIGQKYIDVHPNICKEQAKKNK